jgi:hypothetical protein
MKALPADVLAVRAKGSPARLFDELKRRAGLDTDAALARRLGTIRETICALRAGRLKFGSSYILRVHETFDMPVAEIRALCGAARRVV